MRIRAFIVFALFYINIPIAFSQHEFYKLFFVLTKDRTEYIGNIESQTELDVTLKLRNQEIIVILKSNIKILEPVTEDNFLRGKYVHPNRFANRYILGTSAISPGKNQLHFNTIYATTWTLDYGLNDVYSVGLSSTIVGLPILLNAQANYKIGDQLYLGATATGGWLSWANPSVFFGYGGAKLTTGSRNNNYTIGGGYFSLAINIPTPGPSNVSLGDFGYLNIAATKRYTRKMSGVTELWIMKNIYLNRSIYMVNLGIKTMRRQKSVWTFFVSTIAFNELRRGNLYVTITPSIAWTKKLGKN